MNGDDINPHELDGPGVDEVLTIWAQVIGDLQRSRVCFYPGPQGETPDFEDFIRALPLIGTCDSLVYSEPRLTKVEAWQRVNWHRLNLQIPIPGACITNIEMVDTGNLPLADQQGLFGQPVAEWIAADDGHQLPNPVPPPPEDRLWGDYCHLTISDGRTVRVLHIGIGGEAAWAYFLEPRCIRPVRVIAKPWR